MKLIQAIKQSPIYKLLLLVIIPWTILAIIFGLTDLEISKTIVDPNSLWGKFGLYYAHIPGYTLCIIAITILAGSYFDDVKKQKTISILIIICFLALFFSHLIVKNNSEALLSFSIVLSLLLFTFFTYQRDWKNYVRIALVVILLTVLVTAFVSITKVLCGRVRFEDLNSIYSNYTPWYLPPGPDPNNRSFPSGHAAQGWITLPLLILIKERKYNDIVRISITAFVIGWGLFIAISRVIIGAHYASDVLFSTGAAMIITILLYNWIYLNKKKVNGIQ